MEQKRYRGVIEGLYNLNFPSILMQAFASGPDLTMLDVASIPTSWLN